MPASIIADFDDRTKALDAMDRLIQAGVPRGHVETYPTLDTPHPTMPTEGEKVHGAKTDISTNGPLGHLQSLLAGLFGGEQSQPQTPGTSEPTHEPSSHQSVYMAIALDDLVMSVDTLRTVLTAAGAIRIDEHNA